MQMQGTRMIPAHLQLLSKCVMTFQSYVNWKEKSQEYDPSYCEEHNPVSLSHPNFGSLVEVPADSNDQYLRIFLRVVKLEQQAQNLT
jgi:hypothetical protein